MGQHTGSFYVATFFRFALVMIGVLSSSIVNLIFLPPKFETKIYYNSVNISSDILYGSNLLNDTSEFHNIKQDGDQLNSRINKLEQIYNYYHEEKPLTKNIFISRIERRYYLK